MKSGDIVAGRFELGRRAGTGGMGTVYKAFDQVSRSTVALKILLAEGQLHTERFMREASVLAELTHPSIVRYIDHGKTDAGEYYLAMEWIDGEILSERLRMRGVSMAETLLLIQRIAEAVASAHKRGIIHRDIKPSNIMLAGGDPARPKVLDFGIARSIKPEAPNLTRTGGVLGTPGYMSPEQARGLKDVDARCDVFAIGCLAHHCLTGRAPFAADHPLAVLARVLLDPTPRVSELRSEIPAVIDDLVAQMLEKDPALRPRDAGVVADVWSRIDRPSGAYVAPADRSLTMDEQRVVCFVLAGRGDAAEAPTWTPERDRRLDGALRARVASLGGRLDRLPDGSLLVTHTGLGEAKEQVLAAARSALVVRSMVHDTPIVIATGRGVITEDRPVGEVIDRAVRDLLRTPAGRVRVDESTLRLLDDRFSVLRDKDGIFLETEREVISAGRLLLGRPTPFVGRSREMATLEATFAECCNESVARAVLIEGPAGRGKSRLRQEFLKKRVVEQDSTILVGRGDPLSTGAPFGLIAQALRRSAGISEPDVSPVKRNKLHNRLSRHLTSATLARTTEALIGLVDSAPSTRTGRWGDALRLGWLEWIGAEAKHEPVLIVIEDAHYADRPTIDLLDSTLRALSDRPVMVVALARPEVRNIFPGLWRDRELQELRLGALTKKAAEKLVLEALGNLDEARVSALISRAEGNAFYLEELIRAAARGDTDDLPETVLGMVESRLSELAADSKRVLRAASIFGLRFWRGGLRALVGPSADDPVFEHSIEVLAGRELILAREDSRFPNEVELQFTSELVREAAYAALTAADRQLGHRLAAEWLEKKGAAEAPLLAEHYMRGGVNEKAAAWYAKAAAEALEGNDFAAAIDFAQKGLACDARGETKIELAVVQAEAHNWRGEHGRALVIAAEALEWVERGSVWWYRALDEAFLGSARSGRIDRGETLIALLRGVETKPDAIVDRLYCLARIAIVAARIGPLDRALAIVEEVSRTIGVWGVEKLPSRIAGRVLAARAHIARVRGDAAGCLADFEAALASHEAEKDFRSACLSRISIGGVYLELGEIERAEAYCRRALDDALNLGIPQVVQICRVELGRAVLFERPGEALELARAAETSGRAQGDTAMTAFAYVLAGTSSLMLGELAAAQTNLEKAMQMMTVVPPELAIATALYARVLLFSGRVDEALATSERAMFLMRQSEGFAGGESMIRLMYIEAAFAAGREEDAEAALRTAVSRLMQRAERITIPELRKSFLERVPDNVRTMSLGKLA